MKVVTSYSYKDRNGRNQGGSLSKPVVDLDKLAYCIQARLFEALQYADEQDFNFTVKVGDFSGR